MKNILVIMMLSLGVLTIHAAEEIIRVGVHNFPPLVFMNENEEPDGLFVDILEYIADKEEWGLEYISDSWNGSIERLLNNEIDLLPGIAFCSERDISMDFTQEFLFSDLHQVFVKPGSNIHTLSDLEGKTVSVLEGSIYSEELNNILTQFGISAKFLEVEEYTDISNSIQNGLSDAGIITHIYGTILENSFEVESSDIIFNPGKIRFAVRQNKNQHLLQTLDEYIRKIKYDKKSVYYTSYDKWMHFSQGTKEIPKFIMNVIYGVVLLSLIFFMFTILLRYQVRLKTQDLRENELKLLKSEQKLRLEKEEVEKANRVKANFLTNVSHELRTPLNGAIGMIELLRGLEQTDENSYYLDLAAQSVDRLFSIVKDLLDFVQINSGKLGLIVESFDFDKMIGYAIGLFKIQLKKKDLSIVSLNQGNNKIFVGDRTRIAQIIISLLSNAVKFSKKGTISISYSIDPDLKISISDEGIGIAEEDIDDIFNTLEQLEDPYTKQYDGLGLGLAIVKNLISLMEGELTVKSELGSGAIFNFTIPASKQISLYLENKEENNKKSVGIEENFTILIAEDEEINRVYIREILKKYKYKVIEANNGKEALELNRIKNPDLILMDIGMPVLSGLDAAKELRKIEAFNKIPILALTAYTGKDDIAKFLSAGFNKVLAKPITESKLIENIKEYSY